MPCYWMPAGIRFQQYWFTEPVPLAGWRPPAVPGIAVILQRNPQWGPKPLEPLYFGDCTELPHARREDLMVAMMPMPYSHPAQRRAVCGELMTTRASLSVADLARKIDAMEARQQEQGERILSLLTYLVRLFEPQPVRQRNAIGFLTELAPVAATGTES